MGGVPSHLQFIPRAQPADVVRGVEAVRGDGVELPDFGHDEFGF